jgi:hypothetical protein
MCRDCLGNVLEWGLCLWAFGAQVLWPARVSNPMRMLLLSTGRMNYNVHGIQATNMHMQCPLAAFLVPVFPPCLWGVA